MIGPRNPFKGSIENLQRIVAIFSADAGKTEIPATFLRVTAIKPH